MSTLVNIVLGIVASFLMLLSSPFETSDSRQQTEPCDQVACHQHAYAIINERTDTIKMN